MKRVNSIKPWPIVPLGSIAEVKLGKMLDKAKHLTGRRLPYLRNVNVRWGSVNTDDLREMNFDAHELDRFGLQAGDVLVCEGGEPGRAAVWNGDLPDLKFQKAIHRVRFTTSFEPSLLVYLLELLAQTGGLERRFTGSTIKHFTREAFVQLPIPLPPFPEQRRIVAEIEKQFTRLEAGIAALRRAQSNLKRYRTSLLKAEIGSESFPRVPLVELVEAGAKVLYGILQPGSNVSNGVPYIRPTEIKLDRIQLDEIRRTTPAIADKYARSTLRTGDIILSIVGTIGKVATVPSELEGGNITQSSVRIRPDKSKVRGDYLAWVLRSPFAVRQYDAFRLGTAVPRLNVAHVRNLLIPVPSITEQQRIVTGVERRISVVDTLDAVVGANLLRATRLRQSILQRAFSGSL